MRANQCVGVGVRYSAPILPALLHFVGLEAFPQVRAGGRVENYLGEPPLSGKALEFQCEIVYKAALAVERFHERHSEALSGMAGQARAILALTRTSLIQMAGRDADDLLDGALDSVGA